MAAIYKIDDGFDYSVFTGATCALGVFDGVHVGHRYLIEEMMKCSQAAQTSSLILTFDRDPDEFFKSNDLRKLMTNDERIEALARFDVDAVIVIPFTREFASLKPFEFLDSFFGESVPMSLHVGCDFRFGSCASGNVDDLCSWGSLHGMSVDSYELFCVDEVPVTATRIRELLSAGKIEQANDLLGYTYHVAGDVECGRGEGSDMGFATANVHIPDQMRALGEGVYAGYASVEGRRYKAAVSVGVSPTFADKTKAYMEAHLLDFNEDIYGSIIEISFIKWLRPMLAFSDTDELISTVLDNIKWVRTNLP